MRSVAEALARRGSWRPAQRTKRSGPRTRSTARLTAILTRRV